MNEFTQVFLVQLVAAILVVVAVRRRQRQGRPARGAWSTLLAWLAGRRQPARTAPQSRRAAPAPLLGDIGLVAAREVRERVRGRVFRAGTLLIVAVAAAAIVIPALTRGAPRTQRVGVVGSLPAPLRAAVTAAGTGTGTAVRLTAEPDVAAARRGLRSGQLGLAIVGAREVIVKKATGPAGTSATAQFARTVSRNLGVAEAVRAAGLTAGQAARLAAARPLPVASLQAGAAGADTTASYAGLVLLLLMLTQYNTWTLIGVMEEKSSRVIEVLLAAVSPARLLAGKVLGIGLAAFAQAAVIAGSAAGLAAAVGSSLLSGTTPTVLLGTLLWLVLGYAFYCWVYAAAGSLAERRDQVQSLVFPLALPVVAGVFVAQTALASGSPSALAEVLAYLPPTAPFAMPALVALGSATWWEFTASAAISILCTIGVARLAAGIYRRAILRTGHRVHLREILPGAAR